MTEKNQKKTEITGKKRGRPKLDRQTISSSVRFEPEIYEKLQWYAKVCGFEKGGKPNVSAAIKEIVKKSLS